MIDAYKIYKMEQINSNLYKQDGKYYRLFGYGVTPNGCWVISPFYKHLLDINVESGLDVYGEEEIEIGNGIIPSSTKFLLKQ